MKNVFILLVLAGFVGCTSKSKSPSDTATATTAPPAVAKAETAAPSAPAKSKATPAKSATTAPAKESQVGTTGITCKAAGDERSLAINVKDSGCELVYTKGGEAKVIATQIKGSEKCEEVMTQVKEKLTAAGFACQ